MDQGHPRASGGTSARTLRIRRVWGTSPRKRGNHLRRHCRDDCSGDIPAQAGEPSRLLWWPASAWGHPRASGGTSSLGPPRGLALGTSPRKRGNQFQALVVAGIGGDIPAQAGEPQSNRHWKSRWWGHPRASGGTPLSSGRRPILMGTSPRKRGNRPVHRRRHHLLGDIPAQAGEPPPPSRSSARSMGHPRASGGTDKNISQHVSLRGTSPRKRGNLQARTVQVLVRGDIPAQAGEPPG